jgi:bacitracin synthase 3
MNFNNININLYAEPTTKFSTVQRFEKIVAQYPEKIALRFDNQVLTYHELNFAANQYANYLIGKGVKSSSRVAIYLDDSLEMISTLLGVLKTGASYIPLPESFPIYRVVNIITDASCNMLITQEKLFDNKSFTIVPTLITDKTDISSFSPFNLNRYHQPHDCVYSVFTSGSTGRPKGVMISDANLGALVDALIETFDCTENDNSTKYFGYGFDASVAEIFPTLLTGATLHIINKAIKLEPSKLNDYFETYKITLSGLPTQFGEIFISEIDNRSLRILWVGGDKLRRVTKRTYKLVNLYGPSETTVACTSFVVDKIDYPNIPIGKPLKNYTTHIVDEQMQPVVVGEIGELCIGGAGVGLGYMNLPEQTEAKFIRDPFVAQCESQAKSNTLYKTGDLARYQQDGNIEFMGRNDFQVKIRGFRIELGEIEQALLKQVEIKDCCVLARMSASGDNRLCAYYVTTPDYKLTQLEISQKLSASLPVYMLPQDYIEMAVLHINSNGKVDRKVLPVPDYSAHQRVYIAARNAEETQVCQAFA